MQPSVEIHVLQGEREMAMYNKTLGKFQLVGLPPAPRGIPQIEVTFDIDANGIVHVSAKDRATNKEQSMTITGQSALSSDEINKMIRDAEAHAEDDRMRREDAETRNAGDTLIYQNERMIRDYGDRMSSDEKERIQSAIGVLKESLKGNDMKAIRDDTEALMVVSQQFTQRLYAESAGDGDGSDGGGYVDDDEVVDAEIVDEGR
jgi:molecular chaperone DnaK